jgi:hypothetical protein
VKRTRIASRGFYRNMRNSTPNRQFSCNNPVSVRSTARGLRGTKCDLIAPTKRISFSSNGNAAQVKSFIVHRLRHCYTTLHTTHGDLQLRRYNTEPNAGIIAVLLHSPARIVVLCTLAHYLEEILSTYDKYYSN